MIVTEWFRRLWYLINRRRFERALQQDMDAHREALGGKRPFGNTLHIREQAREVWGWRWLDDLWRDLVYGANSLLRAPGFALSAIVVLALGMGVNLTEFQMMDAAIHHLLVHDVSTLASFRRNVNGRLRLYFDPDVVGFYRLHNTTLSSIFEESEIPAVPSLPGVTMDGDPTLLRTAFVSGNYFCALGIQPAFGRLLNEHDTAGDAEPVAVLSYRYWERTFGSNPEVINQTIRLNGNPIRIVGVGPYTFSGVNYMNTSVWLPDSLKTYMGAVDGPARKILGGSPQAFGRLKPGVTFKAAEAEIQSLATELRKEQPKLFQPKERIQVTAVDALDLNDVQTAA